jgi:hypothetical protein
MELIMSSEQAEATRKQCSLLTEKLKVDGMANGEMSLETSLEVARRSGLPFTTRQISAAHNRAAGYVLGEHLANLDESSLSDAESSELAEGYKRLFEFH